MELIEAIMLGLLQGLTEFLPVSSSGHLEIGQYLFGITFKPEASLTFGVLVHAATVLSTITIFWGELGRLAKGGLEFKYNEQTQYILKIVVSMLPIMVVGLFFKDQVEALFNRGISFTASMLLVTAALLTFSHFFRPKTTHAVTYKNAFIIGLAQAIAVIPGISRSGATISTGLMAGVDRTQLAKFSFLMVLVPILGEAFLELIKGNFSPAASGIPTMTLIAGFLAAYISGLFACRVMIRIVSKGKLYYFAIYCAILGIATLIFA